MSSPLLLTLLSKVLGAPTCVTFTTYYRRESTSDELFCGGRNEGPNRSGEWGGGGESLL